MGAEQTVLHVVTEISRRGGGVAESAKLLVTGLHSRIGDNVCVLAVEDEFTDVDRGGWGSVRVALCKPLRTNRFGFAPWFPFALFYERPLLVHLHGLWTFQGAAVALWKAVTRRPVVLSVHGMLDEWIVGRSPWRKAIVSVLYQDWLIRNAECVQALTEAEKASVLKSVPAARVEIIPNFVEPMAGPGNEHPTWWSKSLEGKCIYLYLGRLHEKKGIYELLDAWRMLSADVEFRVRNELVFCGWPDGADAFIGEINAQQEYLGNVRYGGAQYGDARTSSLKHATYFILPSKSEGLPMAVLEAWQAGTPVIMTEHCNLPIGFTAGAAIRTGTDAGEIAAAIRIAAARTDRERQDMIKAGHEIVRSSFSRDKVIDSMLAVYRRLAHGGSQEIRQCGAST